MDYWPGGDGGFSVCQIGKMHYYLSGMAGTISQDVIIDCNSNININITENTIINFNYFSTGDIIVNQGNTLTIKCKLYMPTNSKIMVMTGAKLIVDGGTITSACTGGLWAGIQVYGTSNMPQIPVNGIQYQGTAEFKNGAVIENARNAVSNWHCNDWNSLGGIIKASNTTFRNNMRAIEFMAYRNYFPNNPTRRLADLSKIENCNFITDAPLNDGAEFGTFITMWEVYGISITGCTFQNSDASITNYQKLGTGIYSTDANFNAFGKCNSLYMDWRRNCDDIKPNRFVGLWKGIHAVNVRGGYNYKADRNIFENCMIGILNEGVDNTQITRNSFLMGNAPISNYINFGIALNSGKNFRIEENTLNLSDALPENNYNIGTWLNNTGPFNNLIYKNTFKDLSIGNLTNGNNRKINPEPNAQFTGLNFKCNDHFTASSNTNYDFAVVGNTENDGIRSYQGELIGTFSQAAGNLFSKNGNNDASDFYNESPYIINYYNGSNSRELPQYVSPTVKLFSANGPNTCPSNFSNYNIGRLSYNIKIQKESEYLIHNTAYNNYSILYKAMLDGGNTDNLCWQINSSWPNDTWELRSKLLGESPYLSEKALKMVAEKELVLPQAVLFEILLANPDALKNEKFLEYLLEKSNPLPEWMVEILKDNNGTITARTIIEAQLSYNLSQRDAAINMLIDDILSDTNSIDHQQLRGWYANFNNTQADYMIVDDLLAENMIGEAQYYMQNIPNRFKLNNDELAEYNNYCDFTNQLILWKQNDKNIMQLSIEEVENVRIIADEGKGIARVRARNLLNMYGSNYEIEPMLPGNVQKKALFNNSKGQNTSSIEPYFSLYPNPASNWLSYSWKLPVNTTKSILLISDLNGKPLLNLELSQPIGLKALDIRTWKNGTYIYKYKSDGKHDVNGKFVINH